LQSMAAVKTSHKRHFSVADAFKCCVSLKKAKKEGDHLERTINYFSNKIKEVERKVVDSTKIVEFLVASNNENLSDNYFLDAKTKKIRTAVVKCNFTDSETLMRSVEDKCKEHKVERIIVSSHATSVQGVLEEAREKNRRHTIVVIEQLESLDMDVFNRLISILAYENLNVSLLICICTSRSAFFSHCSMDNRHLLFAEFFPLASPQDQFDQVAAALTRNDDEKAPKLYLSGALLHFLKHRFLLVDFSLSELKKIVRLAIVENFLKYDEFHAKQEDDDFPDHLPAYWTWFDMLFDLIVEACEGKGVPSQIDLHSELQRDPASFWMENKAIAVLKNWFSSKPWEELCNLIESIALVIKDASPEESKVLSDRAAHLRAAAAAKAAATASTSSDAPPTPSTPSAPAPVKMTMADLLKQNREKKAAAQANGDQLRDAIGEVIRMMRRQLFGWSVHEDYLLMVPEGLKIADLTNQLLTRTDERLAAAYSALAGIDQFKAVPMARWGEMVAGRMDNGEFYDCVAQLERMGAIKDMSKQGRRAVMLQTRPMRSFN
ncbi:hypothetical protein PENTCL1PPCAC_12535, partial [Pristionchus entomophagus]